MHSLVLACLFQKDSEKFLLNAANWQHFLIPFIIYVHKIPKRENSVLAL